MAVLATALLVVAPFWIMKPFLGAIAWATFLTVATWPQMRKLEGLLWGKRSLSAIVMALVLLGLFAGPIAALAIGLVKNLDAIRGFASNAATFHLPDAPAWLGKVPIVGGKVQAAWAGIAGAGVPGLAAKAEPHLRGAASWIATKFGGVGAFVIQFLLTVAIQVVMFMRGEQAVAGIRAFARRLGGQYGEEAVELVGGTIRSVALGVVVTALAQALFAGVGLAIARVPFVALLTVVMFALCVSQIGANPILVPVIIWCFHAKGVGWGVFMIVWTVATSFVNDLLRPVLLKKNVQLPVLVTLAGVAGGLVSLGIIGLFVGPVLLAATYTLLKAWVQEDPTVMRAPEDRARLT
jgi:predicted PurR-regulated permease PerM